eukprot:1085_1
MSINNCQKEEAFTLMLLDLDDTLIPTSIRQFLFKNFEIDIFEVLKQTSLKRLQRNIIRSLQTIHQKITCTISTFNHLEIALISNGTMRWLQKTLSPHDPLQPQKGAGKRKTAAHFDILYDYFKCNNISIHSAKAENDYKAPRDRYLQREKPKDAWMLKYKSLCALIGRKQKALNMKCTQIISFGDGFNEREALKVYSEASKIRCIHFEMVKAPTVHQLSKQWNAIANEIDIATLINMEFFICNGVEGAAKWVQTNYLVYAMNDHIKTCSNNEECTGKHQLNCMSKYFSVWMEDENKKKYRFLYVVDKVRLRRHVMKRKNKYDGTAYQKVVDVFCSHLEFRSALNALHNVRRK